MNQRNVTKEAARVARVALDSRGRVALSWYLRVIPADSMSIKDTIPALQAAIQEASGCDKRGGQLRILFNLIGR